MGNEQNEASVTLEPIQHKSNFRQKKQRDTISANYFIDADIKTLKLKFHVTTLLVIYKFY
jgi:hypothetical protein